MGRLQVKVTLPIPYSCLGQSTRLINKHNHDKQTDDKFTEILLPKWKNILNLVILS